VAIDGETFSETVLKSADSDGQYISLNSFLGEARFQPGKNYFFHSYYNF